MIKSFIANLPIIHASYNFLALILFCCQGFLGLKIKIQKSKKIFPIETVKIHRKLGAYLTVFGIAGFLGGVAMLFIYTKTFIKYTLHYASGAALALLILVTYLISRKIPSDSPRFRRYHLVTGGMIILLYITQTVTGIKKLLAIF